MPLIPPRNRVLLAVGNDEDDLSWIKFDKIQDKRCPAVSFNLEAIPLLLELMFFHMFWGTEMIEGGQF